MSRPPRTSADPGPSETARRVAAYRLGFDRVSAEQGDPAADERLAAALPAAMRLRPLALTIWAFASGTPLADAVGDYHAQLPAIDAAALALGQS